MIKQIPNRKDIDTMRIDNKTVSLLVVMISCMASLSSCEDIIEKDITKKELVLIAPGDNLRTSIASQTFWWEELAGARTYNLQIVSPSFESVETVLADTVLTKNKFLINLYPGKFEWRLKAQNGSYESAYILRSIEIDSTLDLKTQKAILMSPSDEAYLNSASILFRWKKLYNADTYNIEIHEADWSGNISYSLLSIIYDTITVRNLKDGVYYWGIKAWNRNSATDFSTRKITIDRVAPGAPSLLTPVNKANFGQLPVNLTWNRAADSGSPLTDSILVSSDSLFRTSKIIVARFVQDTKLDNAVQDTGTYFWRVKSVDAAHNQGQFAAARRFKVLNK
jgi:hypothetical protein